MEADLKAIVIYKQCVIFILPVPVFHNYFTGLMFLECSAKT